IFIHNENIFSSGTLKRLENNSLFLFLKKFRYFLGFPGDNGPWAQDFRKMLEIHFINGIGQAGGMVQYDYPIPHCYLAEDIWGILCPVPAVYVLGGIVAKVKHIQ